MFTETSIRAESKTKLNPPIFMINYKAYSRALGENAVTLTEIIEEVAQTYTNITFIIAPQPSDIRLLRNIVERVKIFAQHADPVDPGAYTGHIPLEALKEAGVNGVMINHSEKPLKFGEIEFLVVKAKKLNLHSCVCAATPEESERVARLKPTFVAFEPPELIGTGISVSRAKPEQLIKSVEAIEKGGGGTVIPVCGAGISTPEDVKRAFDLGAKGILVASAIIKSSDPAKLISEMAESMEDKI